jgi:hypothetical protein
MINENVISTIKSDSILAKWVFKVRISIFKKLESKVDLDKIKNALDVGVTAEKDRPETNIFEVLYPYKDRVTGLSMQDAKWIEEQWSGMKYLCGDGRNIPLSDNSFDLVFSHAVIEHVGDWDNQNKFVSECVRVAKKYVFLTTPNRWYPIETHTALPFLHWLPKPIYRKILKMLHLGFFAEEANLNLLTKKEFKNICRKLEIKQYEILEERFLGFKSNLILFIDKQAQEINLFPLTR